MMRTALVVLVLARGIARAEDPVQEITADEPTPPPPAPTPAPAPAAAPAEPAQPVHTMDELTVPPSFLRFGINFFGDTSLIWARPAEPAVTFSLGAIGLRMLAELGSSVDALGEVAFETTDDGPLTDVEQLALRWRKGPGMLTVGRFHTDVGYWNTAYHHGRWLQTPVERPHALRFEDDGGLVPVHWVGAQYTLEARSEAGRFAVMVAAGNGRGTIVDDVRVTTDTNAAKSALLKLRFKTARFEIGVTAIYDLIARATAAIRPALPGEKIHELIGNAYLAVRGVRAIASLEGYAFQHKGDRDSWRTFSGYALAGYAVAPWLTPYAAVDIVRGADDDPFFTPDPAMPAMHDVLEALVGARFETSESSALKLELQTRKRPEIERDYMAVANWSFGL